MARSRKSRNAPTKHHPVKVERHDGPPLGNRPVWSGNLRLGDEVIDPVAAFEYLSDAEAAPRMVDIAERIIEQSDGPFDTRKCKERNEEALRDLVRRRREGTSSRIEAPAPEKSNIIDLVEAIKHSLKESPGVREPKPVRHASKANRAR